MREADHGIGVGVTVDRFLHKSIKCAFHKVRGSTEDLELMFLTISPGIVRDLSPGNGDMHRFFVSVTAAQPNSMQFGCI